MHLVQAALSSVQTRQSASNGVHVAPAAVVRTSAGDVVGSEKLGNAVGSEVGCAVGGRVGLTKNVEPPPQPQHIVPAVKVLESAGMPQRKGNKS